MVLVQGQPTVMVVLALELVVVVHMGAMITIAQDMLVLALRALYI